MNKTVINCHDQERNKKTFVLELKQMNTRGSYLSDFHRFSFWNSSVPYFCISTKQFMFFMISDLN